MRAPAAEPVPALAALRAAHEALQQRGESPARAEAFSRFEAQGLPGRADEAWRYTSVATLAKTPFVPAPRPAKDALAAVAGEAAAASFPASTRVVLVNGRVAALPAPGALDAAVTLESRAPAVVAPPAGETAFEALNLALAEDCLHVTVRGAVTAPLHVLHVLHAPPTNEAAAPFACHPRLEIVLERGADLTLVEHHVVHGAPGASLVDSGVVVRIGDGARLRHVKVGDEDAAATHLGHARVEVGRDGRYHSVFCRFGARLARDEAHVRLAGEGAECSLDGLFQVEGAQHADVHTTVEHAVPHCTSNQTVKGIVGGRARGVFFGRVIVRPGAQKTAAEQRNDNLLLSDEALVDTTPQLEIFADDVQCRHGSTIGQLRPEALHYLRSRGIGAVEARTLLTFAFANEVLDRLPVESVRDALVARIAGAPS